MRQRTFDYKGSILDLESSLTDSICGLINSIYGSFYTVIADDCDRMKLEKWYTIPFSN